MPANAPSAHTVMVYDNTAVGKRWVQPLLTSSWMVGGAWYRARGLLHATHGAGTWHEALAWLCAYSAEHPVGEIQFWGHGRFGAAYIARERLDAAALVRGHPHHDALSRLKRQLRPDALWWFRTCETFGKPEGHAFAERWTDFFGRPAAAHTFVIGPWQSGLSVLLPGQKPWWDPHEGLLRPDDPIAQMSTRHAARTIACTTGRIPEALWPRYSADLSMG